MWSFTSRVHFCRLYLIFITNQRAFSDTIILKAFCRIGRLYCKFVWPIWYNGGFSKFCLGSNFLESVDILIILEFLLLTLYNIFTSLRSGYSDLVSLKVNLFLFYSSLHPFSVWALQPTPFPVVAYFFDACAKCILALLGHYCNPISEEIQKK